MFLITGAAGNVREESVDTCSDLTVTGALPEWAPMPLVREVTGARTFEGWVVAHPAAFR